MLWLLIALVAAPEAKEVTAAANAFAQGQAAQVAGRHREAAEKFELADFILPSDAALKSAARARLKAGDFARAATHAVTLQGRCSTANCQTLAAKILKRTSPAVTRVTATCTKPCTLLLDGKVLSIRPDRSHDVFVLPGDHQLSADFSEGDVATRAIEAQAGETVVVWLAPPTPPPPPPVPTLATPAPPPPSQATEPPPGATVELERSGWSPWVFAAGAGVTAGLLGTTIWSGFDTRAAYDDYVALPTDQGFDDGRSKRHRTNILLGSTALIGAATLVLAIFGTDWGGL